MKTKIQSWGQVGTWAIVSLLVVWACSVPSARAQQRQNNLMQPRVQPPAEPAVIEVIRLQHTLADDMAKTVSGVFAQRFGAQGVRVAADQQTNSIVISATKEALGTVKELIQSLDKDAEMRHQLKIFSLQHADLSSAILKTLSAVLDPRTQLSYDPERNAVLAVGPESSLAVIEAVLKRFDEMPTLKDQAVPRKQQNLQVRIVWLVANLDDNSASEPPKDLDNVLKELERVGITNMKMAAQLIVNALGGEEFEASGSANVLQTCKLTVRGMIGNPVSNRHTADSPADQYLLELDVSAMGGGDTPMYLCQLETSIKVPIGRSVVLGVTPINSKQSAFVVQVIARMSDE